MIARAEHVIGLLRSRHVCVGWSLDEKAADRALQYFRRGCPDDEIEWQATLDFIGTHGQCLDWIFRGVPDGMICQRAARSMRAASSTDPIFAAIEAHRAAEAAFAKMANEEEFTKEDDPCRPAVVIAYDQASDSADKAA